MSDIYIGKVFQKGNNFIDFETYGKNQVEDKGDRLIITVEISDKHHDIIKFDKLYMITTGKDGYKADIAGEEAFVKNIKEVEKVEPDKCDCDLKIKKLEGEKEWLQTELDDVDDDLKKCEKSRIIIAVATFCIGLVIGLLI